MYEKYLIDFLYNLKFNIKILITFYAVLKITYSKLLSSSEFPSSE